MKLIKTVDAEGHILCHDITQIIKGVTKDAVFRKGHVVKKEDIPVLLSVGKENLFVWEKEEGMLHENEAAEILYSICAGSKTPCLQPTPVKEGKIDIIANCDGLFQVDTQRLFALNNLGEIVIATRAGNFAVKKGDKLVGTRVVPLVIPADKMERAKTVAGELPLLNLIPFKHKKAAIITTGSEVAKGRIKDTFTPTLVEKLSEYDIEIIDKVILGDEPEQITKAIFQMKQKGAQLILCTGGMSVDPDDKTPLAIKNTGAKIVSYGAPVLPGAMFMLAYMPQNVTIMGLPGCVMYAKRTIFDLVLPRVLADVPITQEDLAALGHGGLCLNCPVCTYPNCGFGKGY